MRDAPALTPGLAGSVRSLHSLTMSAALTGSTNRMCVYSSRFNAMVKVAIRGRPQITREIRQRKTKMRFRLDSGSVMDRAISAAVLPLDMLIISYWLAWYCTKPFFCADLRRFKCTLSRDGTISPLRRRCERSRRLRARASSLSIVASQRRTLREPRNSGVRGDRARRSPNPRPPFATPTQVWQFWPRHHTVLFSDAAGTLDGRWRQRVPRAIGFPPR